MIKYKGNEIITETLLYGETFKYKIIGFDDYFVSIVDIDTGRQYFCDRDVFEKKNNINFDDYMDGVIMNKKDIKEFEMKEKDGTLYIRLPENYYEDEWKLYKNGVFELKEGLTILVGCNGYGKSTTIKAFENIIKNAGYEILRFNNYHEGGSKSVGKALFDNDLSLAASIITGSEGEGVLSNIFKIARKLGNYVNSFNQDKLFVFMDAIDSLSINTIDELKRKLFDLALKDAKRLNKKLYIFISANDYEFANGEQCLDVYNNKYITFKDYEEYKKFILKTSEIKSKRYLDKE